MISNGTRIQNIQRDMTHAYDCIMIGGEPTEYEKKVAEILYDALQDIHKAKIMLKK